MMGMDLELFRQILADDRLHIGLAIVDRVTVSDDRTSVAVDMTIVPEMRKIVATDTWDSVGDNTCHGDLPDVKDLCLIATVDGEADHTFIIKRLASGEETLPEQIKDGDFVSLAKPGKNYWVGTPDGNTYIGKGDKSAKPEENLVLGKVLKQLLADQLTQASDFADKTSQLASQVKSLADQVQSLTTQVTLLVTALVTDSATLAIFAPATESTAPTIVSKLPTILAGIVAAGTQAQILSGQITGKKTQFDNLKSSPVNDGKILSDIAFTEKGS